MARLHTAKWFEHRAFFKNLSGRWASTKRDHNIPSVERWQMVVGDKSLEWYHMFPQKMFLYFPPLGLKCEHFLKQIFGYTALHCALIDWIWSVKCTCMVCLCKYHNWVTQGVGSLLNLVGPTPTRRYHGWFRAGKFWVSRSLEMTFSESSFLLFVIIEIRTLDMVFKFKNFFDTPSPFIRVKSFFDPPIYKGKTSFAHPPSHLPTPPPHK
jgi:hypothetical protein